MNRQKGYSLVEVAIVLVIISLLMGAGVAGFKNYRDRAEYLGDGRANALDELIALDKGKIDRIGAPIPDPNADPADPVPEPVVEPEFEEQDPVDRRPRWVRWMEWWKNLGWGNNSRRNRNG